MGPLKRQIFLGWEMREAAAYAVARASIQKHLSAPIPVHGLILERLQEQGLYTRPIGIGIPHPDPVMWDTISNAPMSTSFAVSRFLTCHLAQSGWALFLDCDFLVRADLNELFDSLDPKYAVYCVKHNYNPKPGRKMDGQLQVPYSRKLWTSFCIYNASHEANKDLTLGMINSRPGRELHSLCWLDDELIGDIGEEWNWIPGHSSESIDPKAVHFSEGVPSMRGYEAVPFAAEWKEACLEWAA